MIRHPQALTLFNKSEKGIFKGIVTFRRKVDGRIYIGNGETTERKRKLGTAGFPIPKTMAIAS